MPNYRRMRYGQTQVWILFVSSLFVISCESAPVEEGIDCWDDLLDSYASIQFYYDRGDLAEVSRYKLRARQTIGSHGHGCAKYSEVYSVPLGKDVKIALTNLAVRSDHDDFIMLDPELVLSDSLNYESMIYGAPLAHEAAHFESFNSLKALADIGLDIGKSDRSGYSPIHAAGAKSLDGLRIIAFLYESGVDIDSKAGGKDGASALLLSYLRGEKEKAYCLRSLGAVEPSYSRYLALMRTANRDPQFSEEEFDLTKGALRFSRDTIKSICGGERQPR